MQLTIDVFVKGNESMLLTDFFTHVEITEKAEQLKIFNELSRFIDKKSDDINKFAFYAVLFICPPTPPVRQLLTMLFKHDISTYFFFETQVAAFRKRNETALANCKLFS